jgi:uncharacterized membrane protein
MEGFGWTVNFANPFSLLTLGAITLLFILIMRYL